MAKKRIIRDLEELVRDASADRERVDYDELDAESKRHVDAIRRQATDASDDK